MPRFGGAKVAAERSLPGAPPSPVEAAARALGDPPCCSVRSWWFVLGLPAIVLVLAATIVTAVAVAWVATQRQQVGQRFAVLAASASEVTRATLTRIVDRVDDGVHSIEAFAPGQNETMLFNSVFQTVGGSLTLGNRDACSGVGFYRLLGQEEFGGWESRVSAAYNFSARVLAPYSAHPPAKSWAMVLEATVPPNLDRYRIGDAVSELPGVEDVVSRIRLGRVAALEQQVFAGGRGPLSMVFGAVFANPNATKPGADPPRGQVAVLASQAGESQHVQPELTRRPPGIAPDPAGKRLVGMVACNLSPSLLTGQWVRDLASTASDLFAIVQDVTSLSPHPCAEVSATVDQDFHGPASGAIAGELFRTCANGTRVSSLGHSDDVVPFVTGDTEAIVQQTEMEAVSCDEPEHVLMATLGGDDGSAEPLAAASGSAAEAAAVATAGLRLRCETVRDRFAAVASSGLRAQFRTHLAGRTWLVSMAASQAVQDTTGPAVVAPTILAACLAALCAVVLCLLATAAVSASRQRLLAAELHRAEAAQLARAVHYTTVSFLAHEARGALAVTSTTVEALAEGLSRFGIRLPSGHTLRPGQLLGSSFPSMPAVSSFGGHSEASVLVHGLAEEGRWQPRAGD
ncbi:unnamed protein product, partial [Symbiodinium sp. KB8]